MGESRKIMVCVTGQKTCDRLINRGTRYAAEEGAQLHVVHCVQTGRNALNYPNEGDALEYLFTAAQLAGGDMTMLRTDDTIDALVDFANKNEIDLVIMGAARGSGVPITSLLQSRLPNVYFDIVD